MKITARLFPFTLTALAVVCLVNVASSQSPAGRRPETAAASAPGVALGFVGTGPVSPLYLTAGDQGMIWVVQGNAVINSWAAHHSAEYPIALLNTVRTLGSGGGAGSDYTLSGTYTGTDYPYPVVGAQFYDGATDGSSNYSVDFLTGDVYAFDTVWANPMLLFSTASGYLDITADSSTGTLWVASFIGTTVEHRSLGGAVLSSFTVPFTSISCLALDPADGTLWLGSQHAQGTFYQYSQAGTLLNTVHYTELETQNTLGGEFPLQTEKLELNGLGAIAGPNGGNARFQIVDVENEQATKKYLEGAVAYQDRKSRTSFQTGKITSVTIFGNQAQFSGSATVGGKHKQKVNFIIIVTANHNPSNGDTFSVSLSNGYQASGNLTNGSISIIEQE
jgi:hypothetical protein